MRNFHEIIIDHVRQMICRKTIGLEQYRILELVVIEGHIAPDHIASNRLAVQRHLETDNGFYAFGFLLGTLGGGQVAAVTVIALWLAALLFIFIDLFQTLW